MSRTRKYKSKRHRRRIAESSDSDDSDDDNLDIKVVRNHIYFWCEVTKKSCLELSLKLSDVFNDMKLLHLTGDEITPIYLHINSNGGDGDAAIAVVDHMKSLIRQGANIVTIVEGNASSAASIISVCGSERRIRPNAYIRIHEFTTGIFGKKSELDDEHGNLSKFEDNMINIYKQNTSMNKTQLKKILSREIDLQPAECIQHGLVDSIQD